MKTTCPACRGKRTYTETVPETRIGVTHPNGWDMPPVRVEYLTGRDVERVHMCPFCQGAGRVDLDAIRDAAILTAANDRAQVR